MWSLLRLFYCFFYSPQVSKKKDVEEERFDETAQEKKLRLAKLYLDQLREEGEKTCGMTSHFCHTVCFSCVGPRKLRQQFIHSNNTWRSGLCSLILKVTLQNTNVFNILIQK